jgi:glycosyltransferase involved in cell wall biosynthesis
LSEPYLSLITPVSNGAAFIEESIARIVADLDTLGRPFEVIVVSDGSRDGTAELVGAIADPRVVAISYPFNQGKGYAICAGIAQARGRLVGWLDADLDIAPEVIVRAAQRMAQGDVDAVIGSKRHPQSEVQYPPVRRFLSRGFQLLVRMLFRFDARDTQVGAKLFRAEMLDVVAPLLLVKRYAFDLEVLAVGAEFGFDRVAEVPVRLEYRFTGTGISSSAARLMFRDALAIGYRIHLRHWYVRQYAALQRRRADLEHSGDDAPLPPEGTLAAIRAGER